VTRAEERGNAYIMVSFVEQGYDAGPQRFPFKLEVPTSVVHANYCSCRLPTGQTKSCCSVKNYSRLSQLESASLICLFFRTRILKSSIRLPDLNCATSQRGCLPRPAQVSDG
jgi:hypothetical protein